MSLSVIRINTTSTKGTALQQAERVTIVPGSGVVTNRRFHFIDERGLLTNGKRTGKLGLIRSDYSEAVNVLTFVFPNGVVVRDTVRLGAEKVATDFYGRPVVGSVVDGPWATAVSKFVGIGLRLVQVELPATGTDVHPVTLISRATMDFVRQSADGPVGRWEDRFRMLFELDGLEAYEEDSWVDRRVVIGDAVIKVVGPVPRCVVTTYDPATGVRDFNTLKAMQAARGVNTRELSTPTAHLPDGGKLLLGVYATVEQAGDVWRTCGVTPQ